MPKIAKFPQFEKLSIAHASILKSRAALYPAYSDFDFTNLFAWDVGEVVQISLLDDGFAVRLQNHDTMKEFYTLIGSHNLDILSRQLITISRKDGLGGNLHLVPQTVVDKLPSSSFIIKEDRDNFDYLLLTDYHAELKGSGNQTRRRFTRRFLKENGSALAVRQINFTDTKDKSDILACMSLWIRTRSKNPVKGEMERAALLRVLDSAVRLQIRGSGFYIGGTMCAFSIFELVSDTTGIIHFEKCDVSYKGLAQYVSLSVAKELSAEHIRYINYEQDLGIEGLRGAKSRLHPESFLKKYTVSIG